jgi:hypothetical protein
LGKAQAAYREIGKELADVPLTGDGSDGNFTAALGIPRSTGWAPTARAPCRLRADLLLIADAADLSLRAAAGDVGLKRSPAFRRHLRTRLPKLAADWKGWSNAAWIKTKRSAGTSSGPGG